METPLKRAGRENLIGRRAQFGLGVSLTAIAGCVDAIGFIELGGLFASFMSGASVLLGVGLGDGHWSLVVEGALLIVVFLGGATAATVLAGVSASWALPTVMLLEGGLLAFGALLTGTGWAASTSILPLVAAMGVQNTALQPVDGVRLGVTFMTGTLVSVAQALGRAMLGCAHPWLWARHAIVWCAFCLGAAAGASLYAVVGFIAVSVPAAFVLFMSGVVAITILLIGRKRRRGQPDNGETLDRAGSAGDPAAKQN